MNLKNKTVLITGSEGFIGSHLVEELAKTGCNIKAMVLYNSFNNWGWLENIDKHLLKNIEVIQGDVRDYNSVFTSIKNCDIVFHLAALISIPYSYIAPESYLQTNVTGTLNILKACLNNNVQKLLVTSTSEVYGTARYVPIDENHPKQGQSPYSASKISADYFTQSFIKSFKLPAVIVRPFNTYGPRQSARAVIPTIITQVLNNENKINLGSLTPTRDLVYVKDTAKGFIKIATSGKTTGEEINISTNNEISISDLFHKIKKIISKNNIEIKKDKKRIRPVASEVERLLGDNSKLKKLTNWVPDIDLEKGLKQTIKWFSDKENLKLYKHNIYNI